jgi:beta-1,4-mannosyl-glycoprotein beta-1,4-N-acetylglucosaminyltransferase
MLLDLRLNIMDKYVDKFVITEATYMHNGNKKKLNFDIDKFKKFKDKITYIVVDEPPPGLLLVNENETDESKENKLILNGYKRDNFQREQAMSELDDIDENDWIIINDIDEIPNLNEIDFRSVSKKIIIFKQKVFLYKFNLHYEDLSWYGSKACKKKYFISPQWLRDIKHKKYSRLRIDTLFSKRKYSSVHTVENGGWHFSNIKSPEDIEKKFSNYLHHQEYEYSGLKLEDIKKMMIDKKIIYDHGKDQTINKLRSSKTLKKIDIKELPSYLRENYKKFNKWLDI